MIFPCAQLDVLDGLEHPIPFSDSLGVKWSQVQILSARQSEIGFDLR